MFRRSLTVQRARIKRKKMNIDLLTPAALPETTSDMASDSLLDTIVAITEQRDQQSLELSLLASLREMLQPRCAYLLDLPLHGPARALAPVADAELHLPESLIKVARNLNEFEIRKADANAMTYLMAATELGKNGRRRVLLVGMQDWSVSNERLLMGMLRVYQNFMQLMIDSEKDTLTGLQNRRKLESYLAARLSARLHRRRESDKQDDSPLGDEYLAVLDLDKFKRINDTFGHLIGDEVLLIFANILRATLRDNDRCFRYGGEEFIVVLSDVTRERANSVLERLRETVEQHHFPQVGQVTVSIGYTRISDQDLPTRIIEEADKALYYAKEHGRNQLREYEALLSQGEVEDTHRHDGSIELF